MLSCAKKDGDSFQRASADGKINRVYRLIDEKRYDEAFREMDEVDKIDPNHPDREVARASIHVARAGVKANQLISSWQQLRDGLIAGQSSATPTIRRFQRAVERMRAVSPELGKAFEQSLMVYATAHMVGVYLRALPWISEDRRDDIEAAEAVLARIDRSVKRSVILYRAIIRGLLLRATFTPEQIQSSSFPESLVCGQSPQNVARQSSASARWLELISEDLREALPEQTEHWSKVKQLSEELLRRSQSPRLKTEVRRMQHYQQGGWICR